MKTREYKTKIDIPILNDVIPKNTIVGFKSEQINGYLVTVRNLIKYKNVWYCLDSNTLLSNIFYPTNQKR